MNFRWLSILILAGIFFFTSCEKKDETPPSITISSPADNTTLKKGTEFTVAGVVTDDTQLKQINIGTGFSITTFNSPKRHEFSEKFSIPATQQTGNVSLEITATDAAGNKASKIIPLIITD
jgi:hypothetical protein